MNGPFESQSMNQYFSALSPMVQQTILHSGITPHSLSDLQALASKMRDTADPVSAKRQFTADA